MINCGVSGTLLDATVDALVSFRIISTDAHDYSDFYRGVKQGGTCSGLIFCTVLISLSRELDHASLTKPVYVGSFHISGLLFADDLVLVFRCLADGESLSRIVESWSLRHGLVLNRGKCRILCGQSRSDLWYEAEEKYKYLGVSIEYKSSHLSMTRPDSNPFFAFKLSPAIRALDDPRVLKSVIQTFNSGMYAVPFCNVDLLATASCPADICAAFPAKEKHWAKMISDFFHLSRDTRISVPRVCAEFGLADSRYGPALLRYSRDLCEYFSRLGKDTLAAAAFESGARICSALTNSANLCTLLPAPSKEINPKSWLFGPRNERRLLASLLLSVRASAVSQHRAKLLSLFYSKQYSALRDSIREILDRER